LIRPHHDTIQSSDSEEINLAHSLLAISRLINSNQSLQDVDEEFGEIILRISDSDRVTISVPEPFGNGAQNLLVFGDEIPNLGAGAAHPPVENEEPRWLQADSAYHVDAAMREQYDIIQWSEDVALKAGLHSTMVAPVRWQGETIAAITFRSRNSNNYSSSNLAVASEIANQVAGAIANQNALRNSMVLAKEREILARISRIATGSVDIHETFEQAAQSIAELVPWDRFAVTAFQSGAVIEEYLFETGVQYAPTDANLWPSLAEKMADLFDGDPTPIVINPQTLADSPEELRETALLEKSGLKSWLLVPLIWRDIHIGHMHLRSLKEKAFNDYHIAISAQISRQISGAIAGAFANENLAEELRERQALADIGRVLASPDTFTENFDSFADIVRTLMPADRVSISRLQDDGVSFFPSMENGVPLKSLSQPTQTTIAGTELAIEMGVPHIPAEHAAKRGYDLTAIDKIAADAGLHSWLAAPLFWRGELIGTIHFRAVEENAYGDRELRIAGDIASQVVGLVASIEAYEKLDRESSVRNILAELGRVIASTNDFESALTDIERLTSSLVDFDGFSIGLINEQAETVRRIYANGLYTPVSEPEFSTSDSIATEALKSKKTTRQQFSAISDIQNYPKSIEAFEAGTRVFLTAPLVSNDAVIGVMQLRSRSPKAFSPLEIDSTQRVADQIVGGLATSLASEQIRLQAAALESADNAIVITSSSGIIEWVNSAFTRLYGWSSTEVIGQHTSLFRSADPDNWHEDEVIWQALERGHSWSGVHVNKKKDGTEFPEELSVTPVLGSDGEIAHLIGIKRDITDRLIAEEAHENSLRIESENRELQRVAAARSEFLSTVSHELRTPLTTVSAFADILFNSSSENLTERQKTHLNLIRKSSTQLSSLINDLLDVSQADSGRIVLNKVPFPIDAMINEVADTSRVLLATREQYLETTVDADSFSVEADRPRVIQIITNLLTNASKFSKDGSTIKLSAKVKDRELQITVSDQGSGISKSDQAMMFSPFFRGDSQRVAQPDGRGLGLAVVRSLVDLHDGTITVDSKYRKGTSITVSLPDVTSTSIDS